MNWKFWKRKKPPADPDIGSKWLCVHCAHLIKHCKCSWNSTLAEKPQPVQAYHRNLTDWDDDSFGPSG